MSQGPSYRNHDDILDGLRRRDPLAFEALFEQYADLVYGFSMKLMGEDKAARGIMQEAFLEALPELLEAHSEQAVERDLLRATAHRILAARGEKADGTGFTEIPLEELFSEAAGGTGGSAHDWSQDAEEETRRPDEKKALRELLTEMPPHYGVVLLLFDMEEVSLQEIAHIVNLSVPNVRKRLHRARLLLRRELTRRVLEAGGGQKGAPS